MYVWDVFVTTTSPCLMLLGLTAGVVRGGHEALQQVPEPRDRRRVTYPISIRIAAILSEQEVILMTRCARCVSPGPEGGEGCG